MTRSAHTLLFRIIALSLAASLFGVVRPADAEFLSDREINGLKGPVESVWFDLPDEYERLESATKDSIMSKRTYDRLGNMRGGDRLIQLGEPNSEIRFGSNVYSYDEQGRLRQVKFEVIVKEGGTEERVETLEYEDRGDVTEVKRSLINPPLIDEINSYDSSGHLLQRKSFMHYSTGDVAGTKITKYDPYGRMAEVSKFDSNDTLIERLVWRYDAEGRLSEHLRFNGNGSLLSETKTSYSLDGVETLTHYDRNGEVESINARAYEYDEWGNWIRKTETTSFPHNSTAGFTKTTTRTITYYSLR